jgi:hypothetical protein
MRCGDLCAVATSVVRGCSDLCLFLNGSGGGYIDFIESEAIIIWRLSWIAQEWDNTGTAGESWNWLRFPLVYQVLHWPAWHTLGSYVWPWKPGCQRVVELNLWANPNQTPIVHPATDGQTEWTNSTIKAYLRCGQYRNFKNSKGI